MPPILVPFSVKPITKLNGRKAFVLIVNFEQTNVYRVHIEKINTFEDKIGYIMRYVVVY